MDTGDDLLPRGLHRVEGGPHAHLSGVRAGRRVEIRCTGPTMITTVYAPVPDLQALGNASGVLIPDAGTPEAAVAALHDAGARWHDVHVSGGPAGLCAVRRSDLSRYPHDLHLLEHLATVLELPN